GKGDTLLHQPLHTLATLFDDVGHHIQMAEAGTGIQGIGDVGVDAVLIVQHCGDASLGVIGGTLAQLPLADNRHAGIVRALQCQGETCRTTADYQYVVVVKSCVIVAVHKDHSWNALWSTRRALYYSELTR